MSSRRSSRKLSPNSGMLIKAIEDRKYQEFEKLIETENPNQTNEVGLSALMVAIYVLYGINRYDPESDYKYVYTIASKLLAKGANANKTDNYGNTALTLFLSMHHDNSPSAEKLCKLLMDNTDVNIQKDNGDTALMKAIEYGHTNEWQFVGPLIEISNCKLINKYDKSPLHLIIDTYNEEYNGRTDKRPELFQKLIDCGSDINYIDDSEISIIDYAVIYSILPILEILVLNDAILTESAVEEMEDSDDPQIVKLYELAIEREKIHSETIDTSESELYVACLRGNIAKVQELLKTPIDINQLSTDGKTPLMIAVSRSHTDIVKLLLRHKEINVNIQNEKGYTALHYAAIGGIRNLQIIKDLLAAGADPGIKNNNENRAFHCTGNNEIKRLLVIPLAFSKNTPMNYFVKINKKVNIPASTFDGIPITPSIDTNMVVEAIDSHDLCYGVGKKYVMDALKSCDIAMLLTQNSEVLGISLMNVVETLDVDVFCTNPVYRGVGTHMMDVVKRIGQQMGKPTITLCSLKSAVGFYEKVQFTKYENKECKELIPMRYTHTGGRRTRRRRVSH